MKREVEGRDTVIDIQERRSLAFARNVFDALLDLEEEHDDLGWAMELMSFLKSLQRRHGAETVKDCKAYYAAVREPHPSETSHYARPPSRFDFEGRDSIIGYMAYLARRYLGHERSTDLLLTYNIPENERMRFHEPSDRADDIRG